MTAGLPSLAAAGLAGVVAFASPCMWPIYPVYLSCLGGPAGGRVFPRALLFAAGFGLVFVALGATASAVGQGLHAHQRALEWASGLLMVAFGLVMAGLLPEGWLGREQRIQYRPVRVGPLGSVVAGAAFGFAWSPCLTGPVLASILLVAGTEANLGRGVALLAAFSVGFALPLLALAAGIGSAAGMLRRVASAGPWLVRGTGILLAVLGALVVVGAAGPGLSGPAL